MIVGYSSCVVNNCFLGHILLNYWLILTKLDGADLNDLSFDEIVGA